MGHRLHRLRRRLVVGCAVVAVALVMPTAAASPAHQAGPKTLVALGDSYASGPAIPVETEKPWGCLRSSNNYAHQVARVLALHLTDVTCSGATTKEMRRSQGVSPEDELGQRGNPPQLDALRASTDIVTLQIGGNDIGFTSLAKTCAKGAVDGTGCRQAVAADHPFERIADTASKIRDVLEEIHRRSPNAAIFVLGYPGIFKIGKTASCPAFGAGEEDARYMRSIQESLNAMIRSVADEKGDGYSDAGSYVDVYTPSAGHTACDLPVIRWVEPIVPVNAAAPVHPNLGGMTAIKDILVKRVWPAGLPRRAPTGPDLPAPPASPIDV